MEGVRIMTVCDVLIVGAGAAGMTAACAIWEKNPALKVILADRADSPGGILLQCIHRGFGTGYFREELTGPEYAKRLAKRLRDTKVSLRMNTEVVQISADRSACVTGPDGWEEIRFQCLVLATGCRERAPGSLGIWGTRPAGVFCAGQLQKMINLGNYDPGEEAVILGSGDIGLILARGLLLCGKAVKRIVEIQPQSPAMVRNRIQCLEKYHIPLQVNATVTELHGTGRLRGVTVHDYKTGTDEYITCDMLVIAAGLIPDRALLNHVEWDEKPQWLYFCGNCEYIHPIVDSISLQAEQKSLEILQCIESSNLLLAEKFFRENGAD